MSLVAGVLAISSSLGSTSPPGHGLAPDVELPRHDALAGGPFRLLVLLARLSFGELEIEHCGKPVVDATEFSCFVVPPRSAVVPAKAIKIRITHNLEEHTLEERYVAVGDGAAEHLGLPAHVHPLRNIMGKAVDGKAVEERPEALSP